MVRAAELCGVDARDVLARAGVAPALLLDPDGRIPVHVSMAIWEELRARSGNAALQLTAPMVLPVGAYRVLDYLVGASATVGDGVRRLARFFGIINPAIALTVHASERGVSLVAALKTGQAMPALYVDYLFAAVVGRLRTFFRPQLRLVGVDLRQPAPLDVAPYQHAFRTGPRFGADADRIHFSADEWRAPLETSDPQLAQVLEARALTRLQQLTDGEKGVSPEVRGAIMGTLPDGAHVEDVARALHMSVRTLQRKLEKAGTTYRAALDALRSELACQYLKDEAVSICEVALLLGFSEQSSFHRAFERWTGEAPGRWRIKQHA
jgi:AraC-like DNA-binding protein